MKPTKAQQAARGQDCTFNIPGVCSYDPEQTVLAHLGSGSAKRRDDTNAAYACYPCHGAIDRDFGPYANYFISHNPAEQELLNKDRKWFIDRALQRMKTRNAA